MPSKSFLSQFILIVILSILTSIPTAFSLDTSFSSIAECAVIIDHESGAVLFEKNSDIEMAPSSMSKLMTLYITFQNIRDSKIKLSDSFVVSENAWRMQGSRTFLELQNKVLVEDLIRGVIIQSGNDASVALAEGIAGDEALFAQQMNREAARLKLTHSNFENATGWPHSEHRMSCHDIAKLSSAIIRDFPEYYHYFAEKSFTYNNITQGNRNTLIGRGGVDGLKTGSTDNGGYGISISAERNGRRIIVVVNGLKTQAERVNEAERLLNYGFNGFQLVNVFKTGQKIQEIPIIDARNELLDVFASSDINVILPIISKKDDLSISVLLAGEVAAPIIKGQKIADLIIKHNDNVLKHIELLAHSDIEKAPWFQRFWRKLKAYF